MKIFLTLCVLLYFVSFLNAQKLELVNSPYDEQNLIISPDGRTLYFTRSNHPDNIGGAKDPGDIWFSEKLSNEGWGPAQHGGTLINSQGWNGVLGFNPAGSKMYLHNHYTAKGRPKTQGIAVSQKVGNQWNTPENISIPYFKNEVTHQSGWLSPGEDLILLSFEGYSTRGAEDIYVIKKELDKWQPPVNIGNVINTTYQELTPFYSELDSILYFSSNGHGGKGSSDVFMSKRLDDTWKNWSNPVPLGDSINTIGKDISFVNYPQRNFAVYSSTQNSDGYGDIRMHSYGEEPELSEEGRVLFVVNERSGAYVNADIQLTDEAGATYNISVDSSGADISSFAAGIYQVDISSSGFITTQEELEITEGNQQFTLALQPLVKGTRVVLEHVLFEQSKAKLLPQSYQQLNQVVRIMQQNPNLKIKLEGHTDPRGSARANLKLSRLRVEAVKDYLVDNGISKRRIDGKGYGGEQPLYPNDSEENRRKNRRVEFVIVEE